MKRVTLSILLVFFTVTLFGYVVYLKDGTTYIAQKAYTVKGSDAIITLKNGNVIKIKLNLIDVPKTQKLNKAGIDSAVVLGGEPEVTGGTSTGSRKPDFTSLATKSPANVDFGKATSGDGSSGDASGDNAKKIPFKDVALTRSFSRVFENQNLFQYKIYQGQGPTSIRIEMITDNESEVFRTLSSTAKYLSELGQSNNGKVNRVELFMATSAGSPAGRFLISREMADQVASGGISVESFFVQNVIF